MTQTTPAPDWRPPWQSLPDDLAERLATAIPGIMERIIQTVPDQIPA
ncbi:PucR family transcriptional regulator, partial [Xanthomonas citri pv. citri]|nr:PucR family transcriptional regulator [Xanthomonas citri pv. citri]